jgi:hypothetical protein
MPNLNTKILKYPMGRNTAFLMLAIMVSFTIVINSAFAEISWQDNCTAGMYWRNATMCMGSTCTNLTQPPVRCSLGICASNGLMCNTSNNVPNDYIIFASIAMLFTAAICLFVGQKIGENIDEENITGGYLSLAFFGAGLILILTAMGAIASFFMATPNSIAAVFGVGQLLFITLFIIIAAVFIINYLVKYVKQANQRKGKR